MKSASQDLLLNDLIYQIKRLVQNWTRRNIEPRRVGWNLGLGMWAYYWLISDIRLGHKIWAFFFKLMMSGLDKKKRLMNEQEPYERIYILKGPFLER